MKKSTVGWSVFAVFWLVCFHFLNLDGNWYDILPFARAKADPLWIANDWYLSREITYRNLFNLFAGNSYQALGLWPTFALGKILIYGYFAYLILAIFRHFSIPPVALTIFMPVFCIYHSFTADEWMINEFDTKTIAYLFCLNSWIFLLRKKLVPAALLLGIACSFHLLVGGYFFLTGILPTALTFYSQKEKPWKGKTLLSSGALFFLGSANALLFAYSWLKHRSDPAIANLATEISIWMRLSNHLMPDFWDWHWIWVKSLVLLLLLFLWFWAIRRFFEIFAAMIFANLLLFFSGVLAWKLGLFPLVSLYPFRVPDVIIPFLTALLAGGIVAKVVEIRFDSGKSALKISLLLLSSVLAIHEFSIAYKRFEKRRKEIPFETFQWIRENTPKESVFLINPNEKYFYAFAERSSVVTFKHFPQLAPDIIEWKKKIEQVGCKMEKDGPLKNRKRLEDCFSRKSLSELEKTARTLGATHFLSEKTDPNFLPIFDSEETLKIYRASPAISTFPLGNTPP